MTRVLILGANGQLARNTTRVFLEKTDVALTLLLRQASRLRNPDPVRVKIVEGDVLDMGALRAAMQGLDVVYANLAGDMARQARAIIDAMHAVGLKQLIFVSSMVDLVALVNQTRSECRQLELGDACSGLQCSAPTSHGEFAPEFSDWGLPKFAKAVVRLSGSGGP